jgi:thiamine biosynthesis lipoprotein
MAAEFPAMGSEARVVVVGGDTDALVELARRRVDDLERKWSRFLPASEVSALNRARGHAVRVSPDTFDLVGRAVAGWQVTNGRFDPTVLGDVVRAGYDRPFAAVVIRPGDGVSMLRRGCGEIVLDAAASTVTLPPDVGFDPGGIGKGLAADVVVAELLAAGAEGAAVSLGGDLRAQGTPPDGAPHWVVAVDHPGAGRVVTIAMATGAVATSTTRLRAWTVGGAARHHVIDPATGAPAAGITAAAVSAVAGAAADAEVAAKAALLSDGDPCGALERLGCDGIASSVDGDVVTTGGFARFVSLPAPDPVVAA